MNLLCDFQMRKYVFVLEAVFGFLVIITPAHNGSGEHSRRVQLIL